MLTASDYLATIVKPILAHPEDFTVEQTVDEMGVLLSVKVHKDDMGTIVGRGGLTAKAIRHLVRIVGLMAKQRVSIRITEPDGSTYKSNRYKNER